VTIAFCLNLARRPDRRLRAKTCFKREGLTVIFVPGPDKLNTSEPKGWKSTGLRACTLAHRLGWRAGWRTGGDAVIIFEDDVILSADFRARLEALELPEDWEICYFGCVFHQMPTVLGGGLVRLNGTSWDAHGYMIRKPFAKFLDREYAKVSRATFQRPADRELANDTIMADYHGQFPAYGVWPPMAWQVEGLSNNENTFRGNYHPDGRQILYPEIVAELDAAHGIEPPVRVPRPARPKPPPAMVGGWPVPVVPPTQTKGEPAGAAPAASQIWPAVRPVLAPANDRGLLLAPFSAASEEMAYALVKSLRRHQPTLPVRVQGQGYLCGLDWRGLAEARCTRSVQPAGSPRQWMNKLTALLNSPFEETIFLDCDLVFAADPAGWFERLGTDDFTFFHDLLDSRTLPDVLRENFVNPHRIAEEFGVAATPVIAGSGHFFLRKTPRGHGLVERVLELLEETMEEGSGSLYRRMAGEGNIAASDELAASIVAVEKQIRLPKPVEGVRQPIGIFLPPFQGEEVFDFEAGEFSFLDSRNGFRMQPEAVHFCYRGKEHPGYRAFVHAMVQAGNPWAR
jgi:Glycosyltransferase family 25 (LPS biosynthesis protein)